MEYVIISRENTATKALEKVLKLISNLSIRGVETPVDVETELKATAPETIAAIVINADAKDASFDNGIQLIQRLRAIYRLSCSMILVSWGRKNHASILNYPGHFFLRRPFRLEEWAATLEKAIKKRLSEEELQEVIWKHCFPQQVTAFRQHLRHRLRNLIPLASSAFDGVRPDENLSSALRYLRKLRQNIILTDLLFIGCRFEPQLEKINHIFNQTQRLLQEASEIVKTPTSPLYQQMKRRFTDKSETNPFKSAANRLDSILLTIEEQLQEEEYGSISNSCYR